MPTIVTAPAFDLHPLRQRVHTHEHSLFRRDSESVPETTPCITLFSSRLLNALKHAISLTRVLVVDSGDNLVALSPRASGVLTPKHYYVRERGKEADARVRQYDAMSERVPRLILRAVDVRGHCALQVAAMNR